MAKPLLTVRDFRTELSDEVADAGELLRNYEFNISQGIVQRVSRFFDALALMDERGEAPPARGEGDKYAADSARGGVMGFGRKRNVCNQERHPARRVAWEQQDVEMAALKAQQVAVQSENERIQKEAEEAASAAAGKAAEQVAEVAALEAKVAAAAALKVTEQDAKVAALEAEVAALRAAEQVTKIAALVAEVAKLQALAAPSAALCPLCSSPHPPHPPQSQYSP